MPTKTYARIQDDAVAEIVVLDAALNVAELFNSSLVFVDVTNIQPAPQQRWRYTAPSTFEAPPSVTPTLEQSAAAAVVAGVTLTLTGSLSLSATLFPTDRDSQAKLSAVVTTVSATGAFPGGADTYPLKDAGGSWHVLTIDQYKSVASAIASYVAACYLIADGNPLGAQALPSSSLVVAV